MAVINSPFESQYGFKAPGFSVDNEGNITATSIITSAAPSESDIVDFVVGELNNAFTIVGYAASNPTITIIITIPKVVFAVFTKNLGFS